MEHLSEYLNEQVRRLTAAARVLLLPLILGKPKVTIEDYERACTFSPRVLTIQYNRIVSAVLGKRREHELTCDFNSMPPLREFRKAGVVLTIGSDYVEFDLGKLVQVAKDTRLAKLVVAIAREALHHKRALSSSFELFEDHVFAFVAARMLFTGLFMLILPDGSEVNGLLEQMREEKQERLVERLMTAISELEGELVLVLRPELIKPEVREETPSHEEIKKFLVELGRALGFSATEDFRTPVGTFDVYWERGGTRVFFEVQVKGELRAALFKLEKVDGIPVIVADAGLRRKVEELSRGHVRFVSIQQLCRVMKHRDALRLIADVTRRVLH